MSFSNIEPGRVTLGLTTQEDNLCLKVQPHPHGLMAAMYFSAATGIVHRRQP
jgi:hypothetical protein